MTISRLAVIGAGTMGGGIAISAAVNGFEVTVVDTTEAAVASCRARLQKFTDRQVAKERMESDAAAAIVSGFSTATDLTAATDADLVIEAVFEDLDVKRQMFSRLTEVVRANTILATNTSALKVTDIASVVSEPARFCGLHYFSPAEINPAVEVIKGEATAVATIDAVMPFLERCGKQAIVCRDQSGFALNRFFCPYLNEAAQLLDDGMGSAAEIDAVAQATFGVAFGPFAVSNIVKPRIALHAVRNLAHLSDFYQPAARLVAQGDADHNWEIEPEPPLASANHSVIADRLRGAVFFAVVDELTESVAHPDAIDLGARLALTFDTGPVAMMRALGRAETGRIVRTVVSIDERFLDPVFDA